MEQKLAQQGNSSNLPHLLKLLDDDSEIVRRAVSEQLQAFGPHLETELEKMEIPPTLHEKELIETLLASSRQDQLKIDWLKISDIKGDFEKLEIGLSLLAEYLTGKKGPKTLTDSLDELADEFQSTHASKDPQSLAQFLFETKELSGAQEDYYNPAHSNLTYVLEHGKGIPISLSCIYILVGKRLGMEIEGCNFPGHFLARTYINNEVVLVDCFNGGKFIHRESFENSRNPEIIQNVIHQPASADAILTRVIHNLIRAYRNIDREDLKDVMETLLRIMDPDLVVDS